MVVIPEDSVKPAIELVPGALVASTKYRRGTIITRRLIANREAVVSLMLSNGKTLTGTRDQLVYRCSKRHRPMADIEIGDRLLGFENGVKTIVRVIGVSYHDSSTRLVQLEVREPFIVEGVVCHS